VPVSTTKKKASASRRQKVVRKAAATEPQIIQSEAKPAPPAPAAPPDPAFEQQLQDYFAAESRKKVDQVAENIFSSLLARYGWARNEQGQVEYVGGE
jgi:hypothetical protein